ncbi:class I SAM-dependent methyltransferase [Paenibacillus amylolyticus]|nr:class I SAM-dependent methyltransferase [Paenibacillus amylolyticus]
MQEQDCSPGLVLQKYPNARLTLIDISDQMLEGARRRFADANQVQYVIGDYSNYDFTSSYDMIISPCLFTICPTLTRKRCLTLYTSC